MHKHFAQDEELMLRQIMKIKYLQYFTWELGPIYIKEHIEIRGKYPPPSSNVQSSTEYNSDGGEFRS